MTRTNRVLDLVSLSWIDVKIGSGDDWSDKNGMVALLWPCSEMLSSCQLLLSTHGTGIFFVLYNIRVELHLRPVRLSIRDL